MPEARVAGPNASALYDTAYEKFLEHTAVRKTVPDVMSWHVGGCVEPAPPLGVALVADEARQARRTRRRLSAGG